MGTPGNQIPNLSTRAPTHAHRRAEPPAAAKSFRPVAFEKASAAWAPTRRQWSAGWASTLQRADQFYCPQVPWVRRALVAQEAVGTLVSLPIKKGQL